MASLVYKGSPSSLSLVAGIKQDERATPPPPPPAHTVPHPHQTLPPQPPLLSSLPPILPHLKQEAQEYHITAADMQMVSTLHIDIICYGGGCVGGCEIWDYGGNYLYQCIILSTAKGAHKGIDLSVVH